MAALVLVGAVHSTAAHATEGEHEGWLGAEADTSPGLGLAARYRYAWTDFWAVGATLQHRQFIGETTDFLASQTSLYGDVRATLDALTWAPSVVVGVGAATAWRGEATLVVHAVGVLAYRPARDWAVQVAIGAEQPLSDAALRPFVSVSLGWIRGAAGDLDF